VGKITNRHSHACSVGRSGVGAAPGTGHPIVKDEGSFSAEADVRQPPGGAEAGQGGKTVAAAFQRHARLSSGI